MDSFVDHCAVRFDPLKRRHLRIQCGLPVLRQCRLNQNLVVVHSTAVFLIISIGIWVGIDTAANPFRAYFDAKPTEDLLQTPFNQILVTLVHAQKFRVEIRESNRRDPRSRIYDVQRSWQIVSIASVAVAKDPNSVFVLEAPGSRPWWEVQRALELLLNAKPKAVYLQTTNQEFATTAARKLVPRKDPPFLAFVFRKPSA